MVSIVLIYVVCALVMCKEELFIEFYSTFTLEKQHILCYLILYILGLIGIVAIIEAASMIMKLSILPVFFRKLGIYSIDIYVIHMFLVIIAKQLMTLQSFPIWAKSELILPLYALLISALIMFGCEMCLRKIRLYRISVGGR